MSKPTQTAALRIEFSAVQPHKPLIIWVIVNGEPIATLELEHFEATANRLREMLKARAEPHAPDSTSAIAQ